MFIIQGLLENRCLDVPMRSKISSRRSFDNWYGHITEQVYVLLGAATVHERLIIDFSFPRMHALCMYVDQTNRLVGIRLHVLCYFVNVDKKLLNMEKKY